MDANYELMTPLFILDKEEVSDDEEITQVNILMALADDELAIEKNHARNGKRIDIIMRKRHIMEPIWYLNSGCSRIMIGVKSYLQFYTNRWSNQFDDKQGTIFNANKEIVLIAPRRNDVYVIDMSLLTPNGACFFAKALESINWFTNISRDEIGIDDSFRYPPDEFLYEDDLSRQYKANSDISYYIITYGRQLTVLTKDTHVPEVITPNEKNTSHTEDVEVPEVIQSQITHHATTSLHPAPHDKWSRDTHIELVNIIGEPIEGMLTRSFRGTKHPRWVNAMQEELNQFYRNNVWTLIPLPEGKIAIGSKWVFKNKKDELGTVIRNKARLVAQGYSQEEGIDYNETFAPVARMKAIRIFLAFSTYKNFKVFRMDVNFAFLNGKLKEEVYVKQPLGFESSEFPNYIKPDDKGMSICQEKYTRDLLKKYEISNSSSVKTPMVPPNNLGLDISGKPVNETMYRGMIGPLMYLTSTKPDIQFLIILCARYQANPKESHLIVVKRIFRYLKGTPTLGMWYLKCLSFDLKGYADSDYIGSNMDIKTEAEYVATAGCCANILWIKSQLIDYDIHYKMVPLQFPTTNLPNALSQTSFTKNPSKVTPIELKTSMIDVINLKSLVTPLPLSEKTGKKKKSQTVTQPKPKFPSTIDEDTHKSSPIFEEKTTDPQDIEGNKQLAVMGFSATHLDEGPSTKYQVDQTQPTRFEVSNPEHNKAGEEMDEEIIQFANEEIETPYSNENPTKEPISTKHQSPSPTKDDTKSSNAKKSVDSPDASDSESSSCSKTFKPFDNYVPVTERVLEVQDAFKEDLALNKKVLEAGVAYTKNYTNLTKLFTLNDQLAKWVESSASLAWSVGPRMISPSPLPQVVCLRQHLLSLEVQQLLGESLAHTATISPIKETPSRPKGEKDDMITEETVSKISDIKKEPVQEPLDTEPILITIVRPIITPPEVEIIGSSSRPQLTNLIVEVQVSQPGSPSHTTPKHDRGIGIARDTDEFLRKLVPASKKVCSYGIGRAKGESCSGSVAISTHGTRDGVTGIKRRRRNLSSDGVRNLATASGCGRLKEDLESSTISAFVDSRLESIKLFLNNFANQPNETNMNDLESDDESVDTPIVSPFPHLDNDSDEGEVLNELIKNFVAYFDTFLPMNIITRKAYNTIMVEGLESTGKNLVAIVRDVYMFVVVFKSLDNASKSLDKLLESQITDKSKKGLGYHVVAPPHPLFLNAPTKLDLSYSGLDEFKEPLFKMA
ncbi:retrovirus-related pol polyprotein from transposon TNT 1-94 [Tanacetum coccineum]